MARTRKDTPQELTAQLSILCLRALATEYDDLNYDLFGRSLVRPELCLSESRSRLGLWQAQPPSITLARHLLLEQPWGAVVEVLKHEMAHQFVSQVLRVDEAAHGPAFHRVCQERGIDARASGALEPGSEARGVLSKVAALLALAESGNSHEAEAAMSAAQRLMLKYNLEHVHAAEQRGYHFLHLGEPTGRVEEAARVLASILREFFFVETLWVSVWRPLEAKWGSVLEVCGTKENVELSQYVHGFLLHTSERLWLGHKRERRIPGNRDRRKYLAGVMAGFRTKLERERGKNQTEGLLWLGDEKLKAFFRHRYPRTRNVSYGTSGGSLAYSEGRQAGERIVLHKGVSGVGSNPVRALKA